MELFLNILWLAVALAFLCLWRSRWIHQRREREHAPWRQWSAFVCALILLFFMVSLTDDLHSELVVFEECSAGRRHTTRTVCPHHSAQDHAAANVYATFSGSFRADAQVVVGSIAPDANRPASSHECCQFQGRSPPLVVL